MGGRARARFAARVALQLLRLYPSEFRRRFGADVRSALDASVEAGVPAARIVGDSVRTWFRAWGDAVRRVNPRWGGGFREDVGVDIRLALRSIVRDPLYAGLVVSTLAVAIGANAAVVDVAWSVLLRTLPYTDPERVVTVTPSPVRFTDTGFGVSSTLTEVPQVEFAAAYTAAGRASLGTGGAAAEVTVTQVTREFFDVLGVSMRLGAGPGVAAEDEHVAVLGDALWRGAFGGDRSVIGRTITLSGTSVRVAGVAPPEVDVPAGTDVWLTYPLVSGFFGAASSAAVIARVRSAELIPEAREEHLARVATQWSERGDELPADYRELAFTPLRSALVGPVREALVALFAAASLVLLLGCVNLAGVTLARRSARSGDLAVRQALGAGRLRLLRMMMLESLVLAAVASVPAVAVLVWGRAVLSRVLPAGLPGLDATAPALPAMAFIGLATVAAGLAVGLVPSVHALSEAKRSGVAGRLMERRRRLHGGLVIIEIGLAVLLVIGAGLLGRSLVSLRAVPLGYDLERVLTFEVRLPTTAYPGGDAWRGYANAAGERLAALPGITAVGVASRLPLGEGIGTGFRVWPADVEEPDSATYGSIVRATSPFFEAFGIPVLSGSTFEAGDRQSVMVSRTLALSLFGRVNVAGERIRMRSSTRDEPELLTIAGVTGDTRLYGYEYELAEVLYLPYDSRPAPWMAFAVRAAGDPASRAAAVRGVVSDLDATVAPFRMTTTRATANEAVATRSALTMTAALFGAAALLLASLGTYGLLAQSVARRRREMGIRMAIGANGLAVLLMLLGDALRLAATGVAVGVLAAWAVTRLLVSLLWNITPTDPATFAAVSVVVVLAALAAAAVPARRAARIDPARTLRAD